MIGNRDGSADGGTPAIHAGSLMRHGCRIPARRSRWNTSRGLARARAGENRRPANLPALRPQVPVTRAGEPNLRAVSEKRAPAG